jgi:hypothetical protein
MTRPTVKPSARPDPDTAPVVQAVTAIMGTVVGLTFLFGFGNVLNLALRPGVPVWVAQRLRDLLVRLGDSSPDALLNVNDNQYQ